MKTTNLFSLLAFLITLISTNLVAQDDLYFDPSTDADVAISNKYEEENYEDEYVEEAFDDNEYFEDDFYYSRRIRRFNRSYGRSFGYFDPCYSFNYYYDSPGFYSAFGPTVIVYNPFTPWWMRPTRFYQPYGGYGFYNPYNYYGFNNFNGYNNFNDPFYCPPGNFYVNNNYNYYDSRSYGPRTVRGGKVDIQGNARTGKYGRDIETISVGNTGRTQTTFDASTKDGRTGAGSTEPSIQPTGRANSGSVRELSASERGDAKSNTTTRELPASQEKGTKAGVSSSKATSTGKVKNSTTRETRRNKWREQFQQRPKSSTRSNSSRRDNSRSYDSGSSRSRGSSTRSSSSSRSSSKSSNRSSSSRRSPR